MKKQLIPLLVMSSFFCISCASTIQPSKGPDNPSEPSVRSNSGKDSSKKSEYSNVFTPQNDTAKLLKKLPSLSNYNVNMSDQGFLSFLSKFNGFSSSFTEQFTNTYFDSSRNDTISPLSIYFAMAQAGCCAAGETQDEVFNALNISYSEAVQYSSSLYKATNRVTKRGENEEVTSIEEISNSIWFEKSLKIKDSGVNTLVDSFLCEPYAANFKQKPKEVSSKINNYITDKTRGLINPNLDLEDTVRLLIANTLYMKDQWNDYGDDLSYEGKEREFKNYDGTLSKKQFLLGNYSKGITYKSDDFSSFFSSTLNGFKIRFMVPNQGKTIDQIFNKNNILEMHNAEYVDSKHGNYETRCIFPEFEASAPDDLNLINMFKERNVRQLFVSADFSNIIEDSIEDIAVSEIKHKAKLMVDKTGVEGAAVTILVAEATAMPWGDEPVYEDFVIDKAFGFEVSDINDIPLFTGIINKI